jgi:hypothetical protein
MICDEVRDEYNRRSGENISRARVWQISQSAIAKLKRAFGESAGRQPALTEGEIPLAAAMELIDQERSRLIKSFTDRHAGGRLLAAAWAYRTAPGPRSQPPNNWPWTGNAWRPSTRLRNLIKAGALFLAEAQRLEQIGADPREIQEVRGLVMSVAVEIQRHRDAAAHRRHGADQGRSPRRGKYATKR